MSETRRRWIAGATVALALAALPAEASAKSCGRVVDPYAGTRYAGVDLTKIRATGVACGTARDVARGAHRKALGITPPVSGIRRFGWQDWAVRGNLRGAHDRYVARRGGDVVRWRF